MPPFLYLQLDSSVMPNTLPNDVVYKLAQIEEKLVGHIERSEDILRRLEISFDQSMQDVKTAVSRNTARIDDLEKELSRQKTIFTTVIALITVVWTVLGDFAKGLFSG